MYEIVPWPLLITAALCFTNQGCPLPAPGWPLVPNHCSGTTRFFHRNHVLGTQDLTGSEHWASFNFSQSTFLLLQKTLVYLLIWDRLMLFL